jgi:hypothetical protein
VPSKVEPKTRDTRLASGPVIATALVGFAGATGLLAAIGFIVHQGLFILVGLPSPPLAPTDYLRIAGLFLFDVGFVVLEQAATLLVPALVILLIGGAVVGLCPPSLKYVRLRDRYRAVGATVGHFCSRWLQSSLGLCVCFIALVVFVFAYHYPVFEQRDVFAPRQACGDPQYAPVPLWPVTTVWRMTDCTREHVREMVLSPQRSTEAQDMYRRGILWLTVLALYTMFHPYRQCRSEQVAHSVTQRWLWSMTAGLLFLSFLFVPIGYAVLFSQKNAPLVSVSFKEEMSSNAKGQTTSGGVMPAAPAWQAEIRAKDWYLLFQNEKEVWLFRRPITQIIPKEQIGLITIHRRAWFLEP